MPRPIKAAESPIGRTLAASSKAASLTWPARSRSTIALAKHREREAETERHHGMNETPA